MAIARLSDPDLPLLIRPIDGLGVVGHFLGVELFELVAGREPGLVADADEDVLFVDLGEGAAPELELLANFRQPALGGPDGVVEISQLVLDLLESAFVERQRGRLLRQAPLRILLAEQDVVADEALRLESFFRSVHREKRVIPARHRQGRMDGGERHARLLLLDVEDLPSERLDPLEVEDEVARVHRLFLVDGVDVVEREPGHLAAGAEEDAVLRRRLDRVGQRRRFRFLPTLGLLLLPIADLLDAVLEILVLHVERADPEARADVLEEIREVLHLLDDLLLGRQVVGVAGLADALAEGDVLDDDVDVGVAAELGHLLGDLGGQREGVVAGPVEADVVTGGEDVDGDEQGAGDQDLHEGVAADGAARGGEGLREGADLDRDPQGREDESDEEHESADAGDDLVDAGERAPDDKPGHGDEQGRHGEKANHEPRSAVFHRHRRLSRLRTVRNRLNRATVT